MKKTNILYWVITGLFSAFIILTSIPDVISNADAIKIVTTHLGYPPYFLPFIGVAKVLGGIALLIPGFPRIKEWAYAGIAYDLIAATYSSISVGDPAKNWAFMFIFFTFLFGSYYLYHKKLSAAKQ